MIKTTYIIGSFFYLFQAAPVTIPNIPGFDYFDLINKFGVIGAMGLAIWYFLKERDKLLSEINTLRDNMIHHQEKTSEIMLKRVEIDTKLNQTLTLMSDALTGLKEDFKNLKK